MKTILQILFSLLITASIVFTQENQEEEEKKIKIKIKKEFNVDDFEQKMNGIEQKVVIEEIGGIGFESDPNKVKLGLYLEDLDFETAYEMHYPDSYGVLVTSVISGSNSHKAGLTDNDIIMEFDGEKVRFENHLLSLRNSKKIGDTVEIKYFRNENTYITNLTFSPPQSENNIGDGSYTTKSGKISPGFGGGYGTIIKLNYDFTGINTLIETYGFTPLSADNAVLFGGGGMGNIGNGWFMGGMGAGMYYNKSISSIDTNFTKSSIKLESGFGGVSLLKKIPLFNKNVVLDIGTTLGGGETNIEISNTDGDYSWNNIGNNNFAKYSKTYLALYPEAGLLVRIKNWIGIRASIGQLYTYSPDESWTDSTFEMSVSGDSAKPLSGQSLSLAIWFGF